MIKRTPEEIANIIDGEGGIIAAYYSGNNLFHGYLELEQDMEALIKLYNTFQDKLAEHEMLV